MRIMLRRAPGGPWLAVGALALALLAGCGGGEDATGDEAPDRVAVLAGVNDQQDSNIVVTEYLPGTVSVRAGASVEWRFTAAEPHSVTFLPQGEELPAAGTPEREAMLEPPDGPVPTSYDGSQLANSGLRPLGGEPAGPFVLSFPSEGEYSYVCLLHPRMTGTVAVLGKDAAVDTQLAINDRADQELAEWLEEGRAAKSQLADMAPAQARNPDGSSTWTYQMGLTTEHADVLAFSPSGGEIQPGDSVRFVNNSGSPHTATFESGGQVPPNLRDPAAAAASGPQPLVVRPAGGPFNSGLLPPGSPPESAPGEEARSFTFRIPESGRYSYVCIPHQSSGMRAEITVA